MNQAYENLLTKIQELGARQDQSYGEQIRCRDGCFHCCHPPDSLFQVEAETLTEGIAALPSEQKSQIAERLVAYEQDNALLCPLLEDGSCQVYDSRPSICRTQGYALWYRDPENKKKDSSTVQDDFKSASIDQEHSKSADTDLSWCELNFTEQQPEKDKAFDIERLNTMLSLITQMGWPNQPSRRSLVSIIRTGLSS